MCGIIGYLGERKASTVLIDSLKRLEYRGYDSAGVAVLSPMGGPPTVTKSEAKVDLLVERLGTKLPPGNLGVGHTRWATHGRPTVINAHPHTDCRGQLSVVHNGIIENFAPLRAELELAGHQFTSETDTEVLPHLIEHYDQGDLLQAVRQALARVRGAYALGLFSAQDPELLIGARLNAPLVVGIGEGEYFLASDITAIIPYTKQVLVLGEGQIAAITPLGATVTTLDGHTVVPQIIHVDWDISQAEKGGYPHYMMKEMHETAEAVANACRGRLSDLGSVDFAEFEEITERLPKVEEMLLLGMGSSLHAAMIGEQIMEEWAGIPARAADSSEFRYRNIPVGEKTLTVAITQSGETADTIVALRQAISQEALTVALTNVVASTVALIADGTIYLQSGPEIGVCSTKTFIAQLLSLYLLALRLSEVRGTLPLERRQEIALSLRELPAKVREVLGREQQIAELAIRYADYHNFIYVGRGLGSSVAMEGALKLKEISYLHAEGLSGGALKHGTIALLDKSFPLVAICTESPILEKMVSNVHEVAARSAPVLAVVSEGDRSLEGVATDLLEIPRADEISSAVLTSVALQLFAYHVAAKLGREIDQPRNLAKSVTVE